MVWQRAHREVLDSASVPWLSVYLDGLAPGLALRVLSRDDADGALTGLLRVPAGWTQPAGWALATRFDLYVLDGALDWGGHRFARDAYTYRPAGYPNVAIHSEGGALALLMTYGPARLVSPSADAARDPAAIPFLRLDDIPLGQPRTDKVGVGLSSRTLRADPATGERLFVVATERAEVADPRIEWHPCVEEIYQLDHAVSMDHPDDTLVLREGFYCYRPPGIPHGPFMCHEAGTASLVRVDQTLVNHYAAPDEAKALWRAYGQGALDPRVAARIGRP